jgi:hypothetical protein
MSLDCSRGCGRYCVCFAFDRMDAVSHVQTAHLYKTLQVPIFKECILKNNRCINVNCICNKILRSHFTDRFLQLQNDCFNNHTDEDNEYSLKCMIEFIVKHMFLLELTDELYAKINPLYSNPDKIPVKLLTYCNTHDPIDTILELVFNTYGDIAQLHYELIKSVL